LVALAACSSSKSDPVTPEDAGVEAGPVQGTFNDWSCLGEVTLPAASSDPIDVSLLLLGPVGGTPAAGVHVRACPDPKDETCAGGSTPADTDPNGRVTLAVTKGFGGYFEATEANDTTDLHFNVNPFFASHPSDRQEWHSTELRFVLDPIPLAIDTTRGQILMQAQDCRSHTLPQNNDFSRPSPLAGGVRFVLDPMPAGVVLGYAVATPQGRISTTATETEDDVGLGGFINVPPGRYTVTGIRAATGERIGSQSIHVRADTFSMLIVAPTP